MKAIWVLFVLMVLFGCRAADKHPPSPYKNRIIGMWKMVYPKDAVGLPVKITKDSIYIYPVHIEAHEYSLVGDSLTEFGADEVTGAIIRFSGDTLIWKSKIGIEKEIRVNGKEFEKLLNALVISNSSPYLVSPAFFAGRNNDQSRNKNCL